MKSAYELAMERAGITPLKMLSDEQKKKIAELESVYKSKKAEAEISASSRLNNALTMEEISQIKEDLAVELASINSKLQLEKGKIRES